MCPRRCNTIVAVVFSLLATTIPLFAQFERPAEKAVDDAIHRKASELTADKASEKLAKANEEERKFYERYSTIDREYYGWLSSSELKKPFNQLVDEAIVSIRVSSGAKVFKNAGNQQIVDALSSQNQALPPPDRLKLEMQTVWYKPDTLEVASPGGSATASVRMSSLKDYISDAIDKQHYPPYQPGTIHLAPGEKLRTLDQQKVAPDQPLAAPAH